MAMAKALATVARLVVLAIALAWTAGQAGAQNEGLIGPVVAAKPITVGVHVNPPFVIKEGEHFTGMAVELWQSLANRLGLSFVFRQYLTVGDLIAATSSGEIDVAVTNLTVNQKRARVIEFTQPWFDGGLRIMVAETSHTSFRSVLAEIRNSGFLRSYAWIGAAILLASILMTIFDRRFDMDFPKRWRDGFSESFYTVMQISTTGKPAARKNLFGWLGRLWQGVWLMAGVVVIAYVTSSVTTVMTTLSLTNTIRGLQDLDDKTVGVLKGTVANDFVQQEGFRHEPYIHLDDAVAALESGEIDAIIADAPVLQYYAYTHPTKNVQLVGRQFEPDKYAFGLPQGSALRLPVTVEILSAQERDEISRLHTKYFGSEN